jgi:hypothetical protein
MESTIRVVGVCKNFVNVLRAFDAPDVSPEFYPTGVWPNLIVVSTPILHFLLLHDQRRFHAGRLL